MLQEALTNKFEYTKISPEEQKQRKILGRLAGIIADFKHPTRNDRFYTEELWDKVFKNPIMQEKLQTRTLFGELGHPLDERSETDMEKIAICLAEEPKKYPDGTVKGVFDILDTPNGRILKTLCDYGCQIGVSSRGTGDIVEDWNTGKEKVDPNTYNCECWDAVLLPAVKSARMSLLTESLDEDKGLKKSLLESIKSASPKAKKVMVETLKRLNIDYSSAKTDNIDKAKISKTTAAEDNGVELVKSLQEALKQNKTLQEQVKSLQEKLSVCNAKEAQFAEEISQLKSQSSLNEEQLSLIESLKVQLANQEKQLTEEVAKKDAVIDRQTRQMKVLTEKCKEAQVSKQSLNESLQSSDKLKALNEQLTKTAKESQLQIQSLNENLEELKKDSGLLKQDCQKKLQKAQELVEHYKQVARAASDRYIAAKAKMIGVKPVEIKSKLTEGYSFGDIDKVCESLQAYQLQVGSLPFFSGRDKVKVNIKESVDPIVPKNRFNDEVDEDLLKMGKLN